MCRVRGRVLPARFLFSLSNDVTATRTSLIIKSEFAFFSVFIAIIPEDEFQGTISKSRNREKKISLLLAYVLHKTRKRQRNAQKCVMHVQSCCLLIKPISFFVLFCLFLTFSLLSFCWILKSL